MSLKAPFRPGQIFICFELIIGTFILKVFWTVYLPEENSRSLGVPLTTCVVYTNYQPETFPISTEYFRQGNSS